MSTTTPTIKTYSELIKFSTFNERFAYLKLTGQVGRDTFGLDRYLNQRFYRSSEWKHVRDIVIVRDNGCDLGVEEIPIMGKVIIHHMNPITVKDFLEENMSYIMNPEYLICVSHSTHNALHYGYETQSIQDYTPRKPNDTIPWKRAHVYIICGLIGSGKTTYAKQMAGAELVDYDYIGSKVKQVKTALDLFNRGKNVAYVTCLPTKYEVTHLLNAINPENITYVWMNTSEEDCQKNIVSRNRQRDMNNLEKVLSKNHDLLMRKDEMNIRWKSPFQNI